MFSYQKLQRNPQGGEEDADEEQLVLARRSIIDAGGRRLWWRRRRYWNWRRPKLRVAGLLRRALRGKVAGIRSAVRASAGKVMKRLKEGRPYVGDLFAGNYLFMQVNPSVGAAYLDRSLFPPPGPATLLRNHRRSPAY
ncbi:hypothetical protein KSP39_PZI017303 [Platanthera zijinensis]|uniref:Uncharacterized protein n=1 Tax=Platanthera zijinensis TaxID=2320716 RepID=A0AAP0B5E7_9ASPA